MPKEVHITETLVAHLRGLHRTTQAADSILLEAAASARMALGLCDKIQLNLDRMIFMCPEDLTKRCMNCSTE